MKHFRTVVLVALVGAAPVAQAAEVSLKFRMVVTDTGGSQLEAKDVAGVSIGAHDAVGVAVFEDGRIALKRFVYMNDGTDAEGTMKGYSTYTFENGDSITASFTGGWDAQGQHGEYTVLSGTGAYAGATGTGNFAATTFPWEGASRLDGGFTLEVPGA